MMVGRVGRRYFPFEMIPFKGTCCFSGWDFDPSLLESAESFTRAVCVKWMGGHANDRKHYLCLLYIHDVLYVCMRFYVQTEGRNE